MDTITFIEQCLAQVHTRLLGSLEGLTQEDLTWRPFPRANCIGEIVLHTARVQDYMGRTEAGLGPDLWDTQAWYQRFGCPQDHPPHDMLREPHLTIPAPDDLIAYLNAVQEDTLRRLRTLSPTDLDRIPDPSRPRRSVATYFRHIITHNNNHHGQVDFIRGLKEQGWDLPQGLGVELG